MKNKRNCITKKYVGEIEHEDGLYFYEFYKLFGEDALENEACYINKNDKPSNWGGINSTISIENVQNYLSKLTKKGATHVEIMFHSDHDSYIFNGVELKKSTEDDINEFELKEKNKLKSDINKRIKLLEDERKQLDSQIEKMK